MWIERTVEQPLIELARQRPAVIVTGSRQTGKTSLLLRCFPDHRFVSLDIPLHAEQAERSGARFLEEHPPPLILDEVQYAPTVLRHIKADIDVRRREDRAVAGSYLLTGSQSFPLMAGVVESLAGRAAILELHSLSAHEHEGWHGTKIEGHCLLEWMVCGGYPELHAADLDHQRFYGDYLVTYLERDVRSVLNVRNLRDFDRFLRLCAVRTGQALSLSSLAGDVGVSTNTVRSWLSVLEASGIICLLEPYYRNLGKRLVKSPKLYFLDTGLCCYLAGLRTPDDLAASALLGQLFETHVLGQLLRHFSNRGLRQPIYFYRDHQGYEVDFVIPRGEKLALIECKWKERPRPVQRGFELLRGLLGDDGITGRYIVTPVRGRRELVGGVETVDSIDVSWAE